VLSTMEITRRTEAAVYAARHVNVDGVDGDT
jgi:hypothetical protein